MPLQNILEVDLPSSFSKEYILLFVDNVSKRVEVVATPTNYAKTVIKFLKKNIFSRFGDEGVTTSLEAPSRRITRSMYRGESFIPSPLSSS